jgi:SAM-dependent methyltransferase
MNLASSIRELEEVEGRLNAVTDRLSMGAGSIFRIACQYLPAWGIGVTDENRRWIERRSIRNYCAEWKRGGDDYHKAINIAIRKANLQYAHNEINGMLAEIAVNLMRALFELRGFCPEKPCRVLDVGAGSGGTTVAILDRMSEDKLTSEMARACRFTLIEPSPNQLYSDKSGTISAEQKLSRHPLGLENEGYSLLCTDLTSHLPEMAPGSYDMVVSNAAFHHFSFITHLQSLHEKLKDDGVMVVGDWHNTVFSHPAYVIPILRSLEAGEDEIDRFRNIFHVMEMDTHQALDNALSLEKRKANEKFLKFVTSLAAEMAKSSRQPQGNGQFYFLEALESKESRLAKMDEGGFLTDYAELVEKHDAFRIAKPALRTNVKKVFPDSEVAYVMAVGKSAKNPRRP